MLAYKDDSVTHSNITRSLLDKHELCEAIHFLQEMRQKEFSAEAATFSVLIDQAQGHTEDDLFYLIDEGCFAREISSYISILLSKISQDL